MANMGSDPESRFVVVVNDEGQHALWSEHSTVPKGWTVQFGPEGKPACLEYVKQNWVDMRPRSLVEAGSSH